MSVRFALTPFLATEAASLVEALERDGVVRLPSLVSAEILRAMQATIPNCAIKIG